MKDPRPRRDTAENPGWNGQARKLALQKERNPNVDNAVISTKIARECCAK